MKELEVKKVLPVINANFEEVKESLNQSLEKYKGIIVTEDNLQDCKKTQQDLGKVEKTIDEFRKSVKKELESPIKDFESKCKELIGLIGEVKAPIKDGITIYDNKRREEKKQQAEALIKEAIEVYKLSEKYAVKLTVSDKYLNLSASKKSVIEDIQSRAELYKTQQDIELKEIEDAKNNINAYINTVNEDINTKLVAEEYYKYISIEDMTYIMARIKREHDKVKLAENPPKQEPVKEQVSIPLDLKSHPVEEKPVEQPKKDERKFFYDIEVIADYEHMAKLNELLKSEGFKYKVKDKGVVK